MLTYLSSISYTAENNCLFFLTRSISKPHVHRESDTVAFQTRVCSLSERGTSWKPSKTLHGVPPMMLATDTRQYRPAPCVEPQLTSSELIYSAIDNQDKPGARHTSHTMAVNNAICHHQNINHIYFNVILLGYILLIFYDINKFGCPFQVLLVWLPSITYIPDINIHDYILGTKPLMGNYYHDYVWDLRDASTLFPVSLQNYKG